MTALRSKWLKVVLWQKSHPDDKDTRKIKKNNWEYTQKALEAKDAHLSGLPEITIYQEVCFQQLTFISYSSTLLSYILLVLLADTIMKKWKNLKDTFHSNKKGAS